MNNAESTIYNEDAERDVLGAMMIREGEKIPAVLRILTADDFYFPRHRNIFNHVVGLYTNGIEPNLTSISEEMRKSGANNEDLIYALNVLGNGIHTNAFVEQHAKIIKEKSNMRRLLSFTEKTRSAIQEGKKTVTEIISDVLNEVSGFTAADVATRFTTSKNYFTNDFELEIEKAKMYARRETGFSNIDENQIFGPGLYIIGAVPACGKTSFSWQLAEQLSRKGETCIFCSYEMSRLELFTKSISRQLFLNDSKAKLTAAEIRRGGVSAEVKKIIKEKQNDDSDLRVLELHDETVDDLLRMLQPLCTEKCKSPIVFIDYLQIIPSAKDNTKNGIDDTVRKLKVFQRATDTTFIVISSFNRTNYNQTVSFESFKESGGIEFTADVVWGLQLNVMDKITKGMETSDIRKKIDDAKRQQPRQIQLKCLKNRQGQNYDCYFKYYSAHDLFVPCKKSDFGEKNNLDWNE